MKKLNIIIPCFNEERNLDDLYNGILTHMTDCVIDWRIDFVDDGSRDSTWDAIVRLSQTFDNVHGIQLSRNFGKENALHAGIKECGSADYYLTMDADLQDDPSLIPEMLTSITTNNYDIVYAKRSKRYESPFYTIFPKMFYYIMAKSTNNSFPSNVADYYIFNNEVRNAYLTLHEKIRYNRGLMFLVGFKRGSVTYERKERNSGISSFSFLKLTLFAIKAIISFSTFPIHVITVLGFLGSAFSAFVGSLFVFYSLLTGTVQITGWVSLSLFIIFFGSVQTMMLGIIGQYVAMNTIENKARPTYFIQTRL